MELTISVDDKKKDGKLRVKVTLETDALIKPLLEGLAALSREDIATTIANILTKKQQPK